MDFSLNDEQPPGDEARKFALEESSISLARDAILDPREASTGRSSRRAQARLCTMAVPKEWGGHGTDFVTQRW